MHMERRCICLTQPFNALFFTDSTVQLLVMLRQAKCCRAQIRHQIPGRQGMLSLFGRG